MAGIPDFDLRPTEMPDGEPVRRPVLQSAVIARLLRSIQYKFSVPDNIHHEELKGLVWSPDEEARRILVTTSFKSPAGTASAEVFPRVVISGAGMEVDNSHRSSIVNNSLLTGKGAHVGTPRYIGVAGAVLISAVSRGDYESLLIAEDVFMWLLPLEDVIRRELHLSLFEVGAVRGPQASEQHKDCHTTTVAAVWRAGMGWRTVPDGPAFADHQQRTN